MLPRTSTSPPVPKYLTESGMTTWVHPPGFGLLSSVAVSVLSLADHGTYNSVKR